MRTKMANNPYVYIYFSFWIYVSTLNSVIWEIYNIINNYIYMSSISNAVPEVKRTGVLVLYWLFDIALTN